MQNRERAIGVWVVTHDLPIHLVDVNCYPVVCDLLVLVRKAHLAFVEDRVADKLDPLNALHSVVQLAVHYV